MTTQATLEVQPAREPSPSHQAVHQPVRRGRKAFLALGVAATALLLGIGLYAVLTHNQETTDDAQVEADVVPVAPRAAGQLLHLHVKENQHVHKGALLFELDDADYAARLDQAQAELATARAQADAAAAQEQIVAATSTRRPAQRQGAGVQLVGRRGRRASTNCRGQGRGAARRGGGQADLA